MRRAPRRLRRRHGFTLIELMIVVAIIAIIAAIAIPNLLSARLNANETAAISTLRNISSSQAQFQASAKADVDSDGTGEFGLLRELSGATEVRTVASGDFPNGTRLNPPVLSGSFRTMNVNGEVTRSGYHFRMFLPAAGGLAAGEELGIPDVLGGPLETDLCETTWCCYGWPAQFSNSGNRTFFVNQSGDIVSAEEPTYSGQDAIAPFLAGTAFEAGGGGVDAITGQVAVGTFGRHLGLRWRQVN